MAGLGIAFKIATMGSLVERKSPNTAASQLTLPIFLARMKPFSRRDLPLRRQLDHVNGRGIAALAA
jgi:hypothetical protein